MLPLVKGWHTGQRKNPKECNRLSRGGIRGYPKVYFTTHLCQNICHIKSIAVEGHYHNSQIFVTSTLLLPENPTPYFKSQILATWITRFNEMSDG